MKKWIQEKLYKWLKKTDYHFPLPMLQTVIMNPENLKRFHAQHIVSKHEWYAAQVSPDCFVRQFKYQLADELLNEIVVKADETPSGVMYSCDLLFKNI